MMHATAPTKEDNMITQKEFHDAAQRIIDDESIDTRDPEVCRAALDREAPGWQELPHEILHAEMAAILKGRLNEVDRQLDNMNTLNAIAREEADLGPDLGGSPMEMGS